MSALPPKADMCGAAGDVRYGPEADIQRRVPALALEQAFCVYPDCRRSPLFLSVCDKPNSSEVTKTDRGFFAGKLEPVQAKRQTYDFDSPHLSCL